VNCDVTSHKAYPETSEPKAEEIKTKATQTNAQANFDRGCSTGTLIANRSASSQGAKKAQLFTAFSPVYFPPLL